MSYVERRVAQLLDDAVPEPPRTLNPSLIVAGELPDGRTRSTRVVIAIAATVLAVAGIVALVVAARPPRHQPVPAAPRISTMSGPRGNSPHGITIRTVDRLLAVAPVLPGSQPRATAPSSDVRDAVPASSTPNLVRRVEWFVARGSMADALGYFRAHLPRDFRWHGAGTVTDHGVIKIRYVSYAPAGRGWHRPGAYVNPELSIAVTPLGGHVGVGIYADAIWLDPRPANADIPSNVTAVRAVVERQADVLAQSHGAPTVRKTLGRHDAQHLARLINTLPANQKGLRSCPQPIGKDKLTFDDAAGTTVTIDVGGCGVAEIAKNGSGVASVGFGSLRLAAVDAALLRAMGLPPNYGDR